jgi:predicted dehydrogenase
MAEEGDAMTAEARAAIVGTGSRAQLFTEGLARRDHIEIAALCDPNRVRMAHHNRLLTDAGRPPARTYPPDAFAEMLRAERIDTVVVTTVDALHNTYIVPALEAGCRVVTEKPMTTDAQRCRRILDTIDKTGGDLSVAGLVRYDTGASMSYHLTAYAPWEGYRVMFNGTGGRLELEVEESAWQRPRAKLTSARGAVHGDTAQENSGGARILVRPLWKPPYEVEIPRFDHAGHGGGDARMMRALFDGERGERDQDGSGSSGNGNGNGSEDGGGSGAAVATAVDGALALAVGLAANTAFAQGEAVRIDDVVHIA